MGRNGVMTAVSAEFTPGCHRVGMRVSVFPAIERRARRVAIGTFDGVHLGHRRVIAGCDTVLTFEPHPLAVLRPDFAPPRLTDCEEKLRRLALLGVDETVVVPFDREFATLSAGEFVDRLLVEALRAIHVSVGVNFRFGQGASGDATLLAADGRFETRVVPLHAVGGEPVSSTRIRRLLAAGAIAEAKHLLGGPPSSALAPVGAGTVSAAQRLEEPAGRL